MNKIDLATIVTATTLALALTFLNSKKVSLTQEVHYHNTSASDSSAMFITIKKTSGYDYAFFGDSINIDSLTNPNYYTITNK